MHVKEKASEVRWGEVSDEPDLFFYSGSMCQIEPKSPRGCPDMRYSLGEFFNVGGVYFGLKLVDRV